MFYFRFYLTLLLSLFLDVGNLLSLLTRRGNLHSKNDVSDLGLSERGHVHVVLLAVVREDHIFQG